MSLNLCLKEREAHEVHFLRILVYVVAQKNERKGHPSGF